MSNTVGIRELRQQATAVLKRVVAGESLVVTDHGHPIARLVPLRPTALEQLVAEGRAIPGEGDLLALMDELDLPAQADGSEASAGLGELRAQER